MAWGDVLDENEYATYIKNFKYGSLIVIEHVRKIERDLKLPREKIHILDWGCGRGELTIWLREQGFDAFGVEVDEKIIRLSTDFLHQKGLPGSLLSLLRDNGTTVYPDNFFHVIFSKQVFEHIADMDAVAEEMARITAPNGTGCHVAPGHLFPIEGHLRMPFLHWLPKGRLRKCLVFLFVCLGIEPHWAGLRSIRQKTESYYKYSMKKTHYRSFSRIQRIFESHGFSAKFATLSHPKLRDSKWSRRLAKNRVSAPLLGYLLQTFVTVIFHFQKRSE